MSCVGNPLAVSILFYGYHELHDVGALADKIPAIYLYVSILNPRIITFRFTEINGSTK